VRGLTSLLLGVTLCSSSSAAVADSAPESGVPGDAAEGLPAPKTEFSMSYSFLRVPEYSGWNGSIARNLAGGLGWVVDGGGFYAEGDAVHLVMTGPRFSYRGMKDVSLFAQVLAGGWLAGDDAGFIALPGAGIDLRPDRKIGIRVQADWPLITREGVYTEIPRFSVGVVLRPGGN
jgi:hypothetical protein